MSFHGTMPYFVNFSHDVRNRRSRVDMRAPRLRQMVIVVVYLSCCRGGYGTYSALLR